MKHLHCQHPARQVLSAADKLQMRDVEMPLVAFDVSRKYSRYGGYGAMADNVDLGLGSGVGTDDDMYDVDVKIDRPARQMPLTREIGIAPVLVNSTTIRLGRRDIRSASAFLPVLDCKWGASFEEVMIGARSLVSKSYMPPEQSYSIYSTGNSYHVYFHKFIFSGFCREHCDQFLDDALLTECVDTEWVRHSKRYWLGPVLRWTNRSSHKSLIERVY
jgi:hypothetical protein